ncbi:MAG: polyprenyl synthetase family protein [Saprospiraceae bacterium]
MSADLIAIKQPIKKELQSFHEHFSKSMKSSVPLLDRITYYIVQRKGKQIRPIFVFLTAGIVGNISKRTHTAAALIEILHTGTLVHDDVVDDSNMRRGFFSINALWKNKIAVLVGDYLFMRGFLLAMKEKEYVLLELVSDAVEKMSVGELLQIEKARKLDITENIYFDIIRQKTASLMSAACAVGAASATDNEKAIENLKLMGEYAGIAYQIKDDLFDYGTSDIGKPKGIDIKEKKMTLPLIHAFTNCTKQEKRQIIYAIKNHSEKKETLKMVVEFVKKYNGLTYANKKMEEYKAKALDILLSYEDSPFRSSMDALIHFILDRNK